MNIPDNWSFKEKQVAKGFNIHVREQLPWYDLVTNLVVHIGRHYITTNGLVYDIGASTGNISNAIAETCKVRNAKIYAIEESEEMKLEFKTPDCAHEFILSDALTYDFKPYDFSVCFLTFMFFPVNLRRKWLCSMCKLIKPGGAMVLVDKITTGPGYSGTVLRRLTMNWKMSSGTDCVDIVKKELSLAGYQRPINEESLELNLIGCKFFQMGEFAGWLIEKGE